VTKITLLLKLKPILSEQKINLLRLDRNAFQETFLEDAKIGLLLQRIFWNEPTRENLLIFTFSIFFLAHSSTLLIFLSFFSVSLFANLSYIQFCLKVRMDKMMCEIFRLREAIPFKKSLASFIQH